MLAQASPDGMRGLDSTRTHSFHHGSSRRVVEVVGKVLGREQLVALDSRARGKKLSNEIGASGRGATRWIGGRRGSWGEDGGSDEAGRRGGGILGSERPGNGGANHRGHNKHRGQNGRACKYVEPHGERVS
jgi:hypothetical protein